MLIVRTDAAPAAIGPYSQAISAGGFLFCSGQIPLRDGEIVGQTAAEQVEVVLHNLAAVLDAGGCQRSDVVKTTIFLASMNDFAAVNAVYAAFFDGHAPARATVEVSRLPKDVLVEVEAIAQVPVERSGEAT